MLIFNVERDIAELSYSVKKRFQYSIEQSIACLKVTTPRGHLRSVLIERRADTILDYFQSAVWICTVKGDHVCMYVCARI